MLQHTPLFSAHQAAKATLVDFGGWEMPLHYGSQLAEHQIVRSGVGMFDVSHMTVTDFHGPECKAFMRYLLANDVAKLNTTGSALYSCLLNENGGVIDDLIVYYLGETFYRIVSNASTREKDRTWFQKNAAQFNIQVQPRDDLAILAVQGPKAVAVVASVYPTQQDELLQLRSFQVLYQDEIMFARTGYTGEDGFEIVLPAAKIMTLWNELLNRGVSPCGLGARDTLRLEAGLNLYGQDMDDHTPPFAANLAWTIKLDPADRQFIGRQALEAIDRTSLSKLVGLVLLERGVLRHGQQVYFNGQLVGEITSGSYSPTLQCAIALARVQSNITDQCQVKIRDKFLSARVVKPPFVRQGKIMVESTPAVA